MLKRFLFFVFFGLCASMQAFTMTIAFACFQNKSAPEKCRTVTVMFEDLLLNSFFDSGFIVTNVPLTEYVSEKDINLAEIGKLFEEEPADYLVLLRFEYGDTLIFDERTRQRVPEWKRLNISLFESSGENEIFNKAVDMAGVKGGNLEKKAEILSKQIADGILAAIKKNKKAGKR